MNINRPVTIDYVHAVRPPTSCRHLSPLLPPPECHHVVFLIPILPPSLSNSAVARSWRLLAPSIPGIPAAWVIWTSHTYSAWFYVLCATSDPGRPPLSDYITLFGSQNGRWRFVSPWHLFPSSHPVTFPLGRSERHAEAIFGRGNCVHTQRCKGEPKGRRCVCVFFLKEFKYPLVWEDINSEFPLTLFWTTRDLCVMDIT